MRIPQRHCFLIVLAMFGLTMTAQAQPAKQTEGDQMIEAYLSAQSDKLNKKFLDGAKTLGEWQQKQPELRGQYMDMLGLWPIPKKTPLKPTITNSFEHQGVTIDNLHFQSKPGLYVTANLYRPSGNTKKLPTIVYVCGHSNKGRDGNKSAYQDHGMWFASNGYNCIVLDSLQLGEIPAVHHGTYGVPWNHLKAYGIEGKKPENRWWWHSRGYTPAGVEAWNGIRAIDYLLTRDDVDAGRIGVTGISGGGAATFWIACADERVKVAVPVSGMSDLESYVKNKVVNGHCDCMFLYNTYQWEWTTIAALMAPRPLLFANSDNDPIFPMDGNRRIIDKLRDLYKLYGKADLVDEYVSVGGHAYRPDLRITIFKFINKHLKNDTKSPVKDADFAKIDAKKLRVFPNDADIPKDALNATIDETFVPKAVVTLPKAGEYAGWKKGLLQKLKEQSFRALPAVIPPAKELRSKEGKAEDFSAEPDSEFNGYALLSHPGGKKTATLVILNADETIDAAKKWEKMYGQGLEDKPGSGDTFMYVISPRGSTKKWTQKSPPNFVERSLVLLGQTIDTGKLRDVAAAMRYVTAKNKNLSWRIAGKGQSGILAAYAALLAPGCVDEVVILDAPTSHQHGPTFLNVQKVLDIPEALGLLAPVKLTMINAGDPAFNRTTEIYKLAGAADKLSRQ